MAKSETKTYKERLKAGEVRYRPDSNKASVYRAFCSKGEAGAKAEGKKLKLKEATIRAWLSDWKAIKKNGWPSPLGGTKPKSKQKAPARKKATKARTTKKRASAA